MRRSLSAIIWRRPETIFPSAKLRRLVYFHKRKTPDSHEPTRPLPSPKARARELFAPSDRRPETLRYGAPHARIWRTVATVALPPRPRRRGDGRAFDRFPESVFPRAGGGKSAAGLGRDRARIAWAPGPLPRRLIATGKTFSKHENTNRRAARRLPFRAGCGRAGPTSFDR